MAFLHKAKALLTKLWRVGVIDANPVFLHLTNPNMGRGHSGRVDNPLSFLVRTQKFRIESVNQVYQRPVRNQDRHSRLVHVVHHLHVQKNQPVRTTPDKQFR